MENLSLVIVTDDREYGRALGQALLQLCSGMMIRIFRKEEFFSQRHEHESSGEGVIFLSSADLILWDGPEAEVSYGGRIILLTEKPSMAVSDHLEKRFCIYKYSQAQSIAAALFDIYSDLTGHHAVNVKRCACWRLHHAAEARAVRSRRWLQLRNCAGSGARECCTCPLRRLSPRAIS